MKTTAGTVKQVLQASGAPARRSVVAVTCKDANDLHRAVASTLTKPEVTAAIVAEAWSQETYDVNELATELAVQVAAVNHGDMRRAEGMMIAQAHTLNELFTVLLRKAAAYVSTPQHLETYMRLGLKAQNQCRMTLATLGDLKNPHPVFAKQVNVAGGHQQVNNHVRAGTIAAPNKVLEVADGQWMDGGASSTTSSAYQDVETLDAFDRAANEGWQGSRRVERVEGWPAPGAARAIGLATAPSRHAYNPLRVQPR